MIFLAKIALEPQQQVEVIGRPSDEDLSVLSEALEKGTMEALLDEAVQKLLPMRLSTARSVGGERRSAILEILPLIREGIRWIDGQGWLLRVQTTSASDFEKRGDHEKAPIADVVFNPFTGMDHFVVV